MRTVDDVFGAAQAHHGDLHALRRLAGEQWRGRSRRHAVLLLDGVAAALQMPSPAAVSAGRGRGASCDQLARRGGPGRLAAHAAADMQRHGRWTARHGVADASRVTLFFSFVV
jgi:hypothetical protein